MSIPHHSPNVLVLVPSHGNGISVRTDILNERTVTPVVLCMQQVTAFGQHHVVRLQDATDSADGHRRGS